MKTCCWCYGHGDGKGCGNCGKPAAASHDEQCEAEQPVLPVTGYTACGCTERALQKMAIEQAERKQQ